MLKNFIAPGLVLIIAFSFNAPDTLGQTESSDAIAEAVAGLKLRSIGPALMGGRIADIAVSPNDRSTWYVAVGSGGCGKLPMPASPGSLFLMISHPTQLAR